MRILFLKENFQLSSLQSKAKNKLPILAWVLKNWEQNKKHPRWWWGNQIHLNFLVTFEAWYLLALAILKPATSLFLDQYECYWPQILSLSSLDFGPSSSYTEDDICSICRFYEMWWISNVCVTLSGILDVAKFHSQNQNQETKRSGRHWHIKPTAIFLALHFFSFIHRGKY